MEGTERPQCDPITLTVSNASAIEGNKLSFRVTLSGTSGKIYWSTASGTPPNDAFFLGDSRDLDVQRNPGHPDDGVSVADGVEHIVEITTRGDDRFEQDENFKLDVTGPNGVKATGTGTIRNDDPRPPTPTTPTTPTPTPTTTTTIPTGLTVDDVSVTEGGKAQFTVTFAR